MKQKFIVQGMTCSACQTHVQKSVEQLDGIQSVQVNLLTHSMLVEYCGEKTGIPEILQAVTNAGYSATPFRENTFFSSHEEQEQQILLQQKFRLIKSGMVLILLTCAAWIQMTGLSVPVLWGRDSFYNTGILSVLQFILCVPILCWYWPIFQNGLKRLFRLSPNMDSLITLGVCAGFFYSCGVLAKTIFLMFLDPHGYEVFTKEFPGLYFEAAGMIPVLVSLGKYLETKSRRKTGDAIARLLKLNPDFAILLKDEQELQIPVSEIRQGDILLVKQGMTVPADGIVLAGSASFNQSAITGESIPVEKAVGSKLITGTVLCSGYVKMQAQKVGNDTTLSQIIHLVEEAASSKAPVSRMADKVSGIFVPVVITISLLAFSWWYWGAGSTFYTAISIGIAVLVISCPCALGLATPVAIMVGTGKAAEYGILFKSAEALENLQSADTIVLDKTGTVTSGHPQVTDIVPAAGIQQHDLLKIAASLENLSEHPLAKAIVTAGKKQNVSLSPAESFKSFPGCGIQATFDGACYSAGNENMLKKEHCVLPDHPYSTLIPQWQNQGKTPLYFCSNGKFLGAIALADIIKEDSFAAIREMQSLPYRIIMLTGDNTGTAQAIAKSLHIQDVRAELLPRDKEQIVKELQQQGRKVIMIGDGINDAPALTRADVGIAIGTGTDIAIDSADLVLMKNSLTDVLTAIHLSRAVIKNIRQNLFWAFSYNLICIPLAAGLLLPWGISLPPIAGAVAMSLSSLCVVSNALRLRNFSDGKTKVPFHELPMANPDDPQTDDSVEKYQKARSSEISFTDNISNTIIISPKKENTDKKQENIVKKIIRVHDMSCSRCTSHVEKALKAIPEVSDAVADLETKMVTVSLTTELEDKILLEAIREAGYEPEIP